MTQDAPRGWHTSIERQIGTLQNAISKQVSVVKKIVSKQSMEMHVQVESVFTFSNWVEQIAQDGERHFSGALSTMKSLVGRMQLQVANSTPHGLLTDIENQGLVNEESERGLFVEKYVVKGLLLQKKR